MSKFEFQPFDKVLVRSSPRKEWKADIYSHREERPWTFCCLSGYWKHCVPYNETTKHLIGTTDPYVDPEELPFFEFGDIVKWEYPKNGSHYIFISREGVYGWVMSKDKLLRTRLKYLRLVRKGNINS